MKITLINPPSLYLENDAAYPPSGLMYIGAALEGCGHEVEIVDLTGGHDWENIVRGLSADLFGITCVTPNFRIVGNIADILPRSVPVVVGGVHPTFLPDDTLNNIRCDAIVKGEAELTIVKLVEDLARGELKRVYDGGLVPVESIPKPARHLVNLHKYSPGREKRMPIYSSRGCPFDCAFCSKVTGRIYRTIPIEKVVEEIEEVKRLGFKNILFGDDDIAIKGKRLKELLRAIRPLNISFRLNQDAKCFDEEVIRLAVEAGCTELSFGIESGSPRMLKLMNKNASLENNEQAIEVTKKYGMKANAYFIVNFPGEDENTVEETLKFAEKTMPDKWLLSAFAPLPGSPAFSYPERYGIEWISPNWEDYYLVGKDGGFMPCFRTKELTFERQIFLHDKLYRGLNEILGSRYDKVQRPADGGAKKESL